VRSDQLPQRPLAWKPQINSTQYNTTKQTSLSSQVPADHNLKSESIANEIVKECKNKQKQVCSLILGFQKRRPEFHTQKR